MLQCVVVCCSVLKCVAVCYSMLQCTVACCSVLQRVAVCCSVCSVCKCVAMCYCLMECAPVTMSGGGIDSEAVYIASSFEQKLVPTLWRSWFLIFLYSVLL